MQFVAVSLSGEDEAHDIWLERSAARITYGGATSGCCSITRMYSNPFGKSPFARQTSANLKISLDYNVFLT